MSLSDNDTCIGDTCIYIYISRIQETDCLDLNHILCRYILFVDVVELYYLVIVLQSYKNRITSLNEVYYIIRVLMSTRFTCVNNIDLIYDITLNCIFNGYADILVTVP